MIETITLKHGSNFIDVLVTRRFALLVKSLQWEDPVTGRSSGGGSLGQLPSPKRLWRSLEWRPFAIYAPFFDAHGSRSRD